MEDFLPFIGIPIFFVVFILIFWVVIPNIGGWKKLAQHYGTTQKADTIMGERIHFGEIRVGGINLKNMVKGYKTHKGLFLTQYLFFMGNAKNLYIPWEEFQPAEEVNFLFIKRYKLRIGSPEVSYIEITKRKYEQLQDRLTEGK